MESLGKNWQVDIDGKIYEADTKTLRQWLLENRVHAGHKARRDSLSWEQIADIPILFKCIAGGANTGQAAQIPVKPPPNELRAPGLRANRNSNQRTKLPPGYKTPVKVEIYIIILFSAMAAFGWLKFSQYQQWNSSYKDLQTKQFQNKELTAIEESVFYEEGLKRTRDYEKKTGYTMPKEPFNNQEPYAKREDLNYRMTKESIYNYLINLLILTPVLLVINFIIRSFRNFKQVSSDNF